MTLEGIAIPLNFFFHWEMPSSYFYSNLQFP